MEFVFCPIYELALFRTVRCFAASSAHQCFIKIIRRFSASSANPPFAKSRGNRRFKVIRFFEEMRLHFGTFSEPPFWSFFRFDFSVHLCQRAILFVFRQSFVRATLRTITNGEARGARVKHRRERFSAVRTFYFAFLRRFNGRFCLKRVYHTCIITHRRRAKAARFVVVR